MADGLAVSQFTQFVNETGPTVYTSTTDVINDAQRTNTNTLGYLLRGQNQSDILQGGSRLTDEIMLSLSPRARSYKPLEDQDYQMTETGVFWSAEWRTWMTDMVVPDILLELNAGADASAEHRAFMFKNYWHRMQQNAYAEAMEYEESVLWAVPDKTKMESATGKEQYSIPCFINEYTNGLAASSDQPGGAWTTVEGIDPTTAGYENWVPQRFGYSNTNPSATADANSFLTAIDDAWMSLNFQPPPHNAQYFESPTAKPINVVFTSKKGRIIALRCYRASNDRWDNMKDPFFNPMYDGAPFVYVKLLDTAAIFPTGAAGALGNETSTANTNAGPRFFLVQPEYLRKAYHKGRWMKNLGNMKDRKQPTTSTWPIDTWSNTICRSRRRHGIIYPTGNIS